MIFSIRFSLIAVTIVGSILASAGQKDHYNLCGPTLAPRLPLDGFCPRLEGVHPPGCCPPFEFGPRYCLYVSQRSFTTYVLSSETHCSPEFVNVVTTCHAPKYNTCGQFVEPRFVQRLLFRGSGDSSQACCKEQCPNPSYFDGTKQAIPNASTYTFVMNSDHPMITTMPVCTASTASASCSCAPDEPEPADLCQPSTACPVPQPQPEPQPNNPGGPAPAPNPGPAPAPNPGPAPAPNPGPAPAPNPGPAPAPNPGPAPAPAPAPPTPPGDPGQS